MENSHSGIFTIAAARAWKKDRFRWKNYCVLISPSLRSDVQWREWGSGEQKAGCTEKVRERCMWKTYRWIQLSHVLSSRSLFFSTLSIFFLCLSLLLQDKMRWGKWWWWERWKITKHLSNYKTGGWAAVISIWHTFFNGKTLFTIFCTNTEVFPIEVWCSPWKNDFIEKK